MASGRGCFRTTLFGCLGLIGILVVFVGIMAALAWKDLDKGGRVDQAVAPSAPSVAVDPALLTTRHPGRVVLDLSEGEFQIHPAAAGEGLSARARFDSEVHAIEESYEVRPDSSWVYRIRFHQTMPGLQAVFRSLMGGDTGAVIQVYLPPDVPIELVVGLERGGGEAEIGGLWLRSADFNFKQGGFALSVDEPLHAPMERLRLHGRMGGVQAVRLGNASPRELDVDCAMGGADIDLHGAWQGDCDARFAVKMGGMDVRVPDGMVVEGDRDLPGGLRRTDVEVPAPTLRARVEQSMGEIEIRR